MIIYKVTNLINNKIYIGQTKHTLHKRKKEHQKKTKNFRGVFKQALNKYGFENFKWEVIEFCNNIDELNEREIFWIDYYDSINKEKGYNLIKGGYNVKRPTFGDKKNSFIKGSIPHNKNKKGIIKFDIYTKLKMRKSSKNKKTVYLFDENLIIIKEFISYREACEKLGYCLFSTLKNKLRLKTNEFNAIYCSYDKNFKPKIDIYDEIIKKYKNGEKLSNLQKEYNIPSTTFYRNIKKRHMLF